jgi:hypothetical protein
LDKLKEAIIIIIIMKNTNSSYLFGIVKDILVAESKYCNRSQVQGSTFRVKDKEGLKT